MGLTCSLLPGEFFQFVSKIEDDGTIAVFIHQRFVALSIFNFLDVITRKS